jgi:ubiquinone/menaquinone biosynthesis C-methylase UbiE
MLDRLYYRVIRRLITRKEEQNQYSGGLWPRLVREAALTTVAGSSGNLVELGCGEGLFLEKLALNNPAANILGVDAWPDVLEHARARLKPYPRVTLAVQNATQLSLEDDSFDHCFCLNTVLNLPSEQEMRALFRQARRILKTDGSFTFDIRNALSPVIQLQYRLVRLYDTGIQVPLHSYTPRFVEKLLVENGFAVQSRKPVGLPTLLLAPAILYTAVKR